MSVTLQEGDMLYLPALWYHKVSQTPSKDPRTPLSIAINVRDLQVTHPQKQDELLEFRSASVSHT